MEGIRTVERTILVAIVRKTISIRSYGYLTELLALFSAKRGSTPVAIPLLRFQEERIGNSPRSANGQSGCFKFLRSSFKLQIYTTNHSIAFSSIAEESVATGHQPIRW